jgi:hypothetical protein
MEVHLPLDLLLYERVDIAPTVRTNEQPHNVSRIEKTRAGNF